MKYVIPQEITLTSSNVPLGDYTEYSAVTTYNAGDIVTVTADKMNYYCTANNTTGITPSSNPTIWVASPMNRYAMLDGTFGSQTTNPDSIEVTFNAQNIDTISFFGVQATDITITMVDNTTAATVYNETFSLVYDDLADFGDYLFSEQELTDSLTGYVTQATLDAVIASMSEQDILDRFTATPPIYYDSTVTVTINYTGGTAKCGYMVIGRQRDLGLTLWNGASTGIQSFSRKDRNDYWGTVELIKGEIADLITLDVMLYNSTVDLVKKRLKQIDGIPCLFIGDEGQQFSSLTIYGFFRDFDIPISRVVSTYTLEIESLI